jgi:hypothetical protein
LREFDRPERDLAIRSITIGSQAKADAFCAKHNPNARCIGDPDMHTYVAMGIGDFDLAQLKTHPALGARRAENEAAGFVQDWTNTFVEDAARNPGAAVIDRDGVLRYVHRGTHPGDLPPVAELVATARDVLRLG